MKSKKINNIRIPISFLLVFVFLQLLFFSFKDIPLSRHPLDELVYNLNFSKENGKIILLGDSITYDVAKRYQIGKKKQIINLTTNKASGLLGSYLLLNRYFNKFEYRNPEHVIIISTPEFLNFMPKDHTAKLYLQSVFKQEDEVKYLKLFNIYENEVASLISFVDIPSVFKRYVIYRASRQAATQLVSNPQLVQLLQTQEAQARASCLEYECNQGGHSFFGSPHDPNYRNYQPYHALKR